MLIDTDIRPKPHAGVTQARSQGEVAVVRHPPPLKGPLFPLTVWTQRGGVILMQVLHCLKFVMQLAVGLYTLLVYYMLLLSAYCT